MSLIRASIITTFFLLLTSCQHNDENIVPSTKCNNQILSSNPLIIGNNDWIDYSQTGEEKQDINEATVAQVKIPALSAACTGFLINADTLMTNNHCISSTTIASGVRALFRNLDGSRSAYLCSEFITTNAQYDFTLVKCSDSPGLKYGWVGLSKKRPEEYQQIYVVQENCDYIDDPYCTVNKYVAFGEISQSLKAKVYHDADTLGGSSGSPIFSDETHQVVGIHNSGRAATSNDPAINAGVPMYQIVNIIESTTSVQIHEFGKAEEVQIEPNTEDDNSRDLSQNCVD